MYLLFYVQRGSGWTKILGTQRSDRHYFPNEFHFDYFSCFFNDQPRSILKFF